MPKILVIEDDDSFRNVLVQMLSKAGYDVRQAGEGNQALEVCAQFNPDLVITDIIMPDKEGLETIQELLELCPSIKIIAMSGGGKFGPNSYLPLAEKLGAKATLQKPFMRDELLSTISSVLESD
ncbi:MAG: response regulator [Candidatus Cloacimonetes bacterium]|jgi:DNA-binding NtrC family response regulator|nr:response regulator [Candidatus Cloacimonadota bacterium]MDY0298749.1 response regulator [Candidatus Cloacimonadaceae bacterium]MCB5278747.1 response regulator [Candidatus Cloacimonadota bacterium]MCK9333330.1 response regulator [Candidatus Cloacimonadota bacterium]MDD2210426.1 response regulator [Candidatus Cloacimonadota bacterium]